MNWQYLIQQTKIVKKGDIPEKEWEQHLKQKTTVKIEDVDKISIVVSEAAINCFQSMIVRT